MEKENKVSKGGRKRGCPSKWTAAKLAEALKAYIDECSETGYYPTDYDLARKFGVSKRTLDYWFAGGKNGNTDYSEFASVMQEVTMYREHVLANVLLKHPQASSGAIFMLKQPKNGGYTDKPVLQAGNIQIDVRIQGGGEDPFK